MFCFTLLIVYGNPHQMWRTNNFRLNRLGDPLLGSLNQTNKRLIFPFQWNLNKKRYNCERMRDKDIEFIHIISIVTVVYSNGINLKILMSHWRPLTTTFKLPQALYIVSLNDIRIHERFSSSNLSQPASIRLAPYVSGSYNVQWNTSELLHDKHMLHSSCILRKMEVKESLLGLWLPLHYWVDIGVS